jgi:primosomal protein N' (replication factor Y)
LARIVVKSPIQSKAEQTAEHIAESVEVAANELQTPVEVLGPSVAPAEKLRGFYRFHMMIGTTHRDVLQPAIARAKTKIKPVDDVQWMVDIDPQDML